MSYEVKILLMGQGQGDQENGYPINSMGNTEELVLVGR